MGRSQRQKGMRGEYILRDYLRASGYHANRVPLSGASQGYKGDVEAHRDGFKYVFEMKCRAASFKRIYELLFFIGVGRVKETYAFMDKASGRGAVVAFDFEKIKDVRDTYFLNEPVDVKHLKIGKINAKILKMKEWLGDANFLVIKDDRHPMVFIRYV